MGCLPRRATLTTFLHKSDPADIKRYSYWFSGAMEMFTACLSLLQSIPPQTWTCLPCSEKHCRSEREGWKCSKLNCIKNCASLKCLQWLEPDWSRKQGNWGRISDVGSCFETLQVWWSKSDSSTSSQLFEHQEMSLKLTRNTTVLPSVRWWTSPTAAVVSSCCYLNSPLCSVTCGCTISLLCEHKSLPLMALLGERWLARLLSSWAAALRNSPISYFKPWELCRNVFSWTPVSYIS